MIQLVNEFVHTTLKNTIEKDDIVIDATVGNGHDTLFLSLLADRVIGFDIQEEAIHNTKELLQSHGRKNVTLHCKSHEKMDLYVKDKIKAACFNLGYLPGSDKSVTTKASSTIIAIGKALELLSCGGIVSIIVYTGHSGAVDESNEILSYLSSLDKSHFLLLQYQFLNRKNAPYVLLIEKTK